MGRVARFLGRMVAVGACGGLFANSWVWAAPGAVDQTLMSELVVGSKLKLPVEFIRKLSRAGVINSEGSGPKNIALFQFRENRWNKTRLDLAHPFCMLHLSELKPEVKSVELEVAALTVQPVYPSGMRGVSLEFKAGPIKAIACYQVETVGHRLVRLDVSALKQVLGARSLSVEVATDPRGSP